MRIHVIAAGIGAAGLAFGLAGPAQASTPQGVGLVGPVPVNCPSLGGDVQMMLNNGLAPSHWIVGGPHVVLESGVWQNPDGTFEKSFGHKTGLPTITCTAVHTDAQGTSYETGVWAVLPGN